LEDLQRRLGVILGCNVDVVEEPVLKARLQAEIEKDRAFVF
jgi:predicted nucleotidyltransferase